MPKLILIFLSIATFLPIVTASAQSQGTVSAIHKSDWLPKDYSDL